MMETVKKKVNGFSAELIDIRRFFHQYPELKYEEYATAKKIEEILSGFGLEVTTGIGGTGVVGLLKGAGTGKTIAVRADIDALPVEENTKLEFSSKNKGRMHACGHDGHIAICLGAAKVLSELREQLHGNVKFIFQPAEEQPGGAAKMMEEGVLENPKVDAIIGLHIWPDLEKGVVGISRGAIMSAVDRFDIGITGKGGHGAMPSKAIDPIVAASQVVTALQTLTSRETNPLDCLVLSCCMFNAGSSFNVIPDRADISGTVRYFNPCFKGRVRQRVEEVISGVAKALRCGYEFEYANLCPVTMNNADFTDSFEKTARNVVGDGKVKIIERPAMCGEDFGFYLEKIPGTFFFLGTRDEENGFVNSLHHSEFNFDEQILPIGVELFADAVLNYLGE